MKPFVVIVAFFLALFCSSCATMDHWLYGASDYFIQEETSVDADSYWDDFDWDIWLDEYEYE